MSNLRHRMLAIGQLAVTAALLAWLVYAIDWREAAAAAVRVDVASFATAIILSLALQAMGAYRLFLLFRAFGVKIGFRANLALNWLALFAANFLPSTIGGDALMAIALQRRGYRLRDGISALVANRLVNVGAVVACLPAAMLVPAFRSSIGLPTLAAVAIASACAGLIVLLVRHSPRLQPLKLTLADALRKPRPFLYGFVLSVAMLALGAWALHWLAVAIVPGFPYTTMFAVGVLVMAAQFLPISFNGIGLQETVITYCLVQSGWAPAEAAAMSVLTRLLTIVVSLPGAPMVLALVLVRRHETTTTPLDDRQDALPG